MVALATFMVMEYFDEVVVLHREREEARLQKFISWELKMYGYFAREGYINLEMIIDIRNQKYQESTCRESFTSA